MAIKTNTIFLIFNESRLLRILHPVLPQKYKTRYICALKKTSLYRYVYFGLVEGLLPRPLMDRRARLGGAWPQLRENGFWSISWRARHDSTGFPCPSSQLVDLKPCFLSRRSTRSTYGKENPVKTFPLVPQLDLRANQSALRRPQVAKQQGEDGATQKKTAGEAPFRGRGAADLGVFEGAQPLHQAPWGAAAKQQGENGGTQKETARCCLLLRGPWGT